MTTHPAETILPNPLEPNVYETLREFLAEQVAAGFASAQEILEASLDYLYDEAPAEDLDAAARQIIRAELVTHLESQAKWPEVTDCDRLDAAFSKLEASGILARQDFTCCQTCGHAEIMEQAGSTETPARGYTFYHQQDTESAVYGGGVMLAFGSFDPAVPGAAIGREVVEAIEAQELTVDWSGDPRKRILVNVDWKRRRNHSELDHLA